MVKTTKLKTTLYIIKVLHAYKKKYEVDWADVKLSGDNYQAWHNYYII